MQRLHVKGNDWIGKRLERKRGEKVFRRDTFGVAQSPKALNGGTLIIVAERNHLTRAFWNFFPKCTKTCRTGCPLFSVPPID
jgi:hypothetical protein